MAVFLHLLIKNNVLFSTCRIEHYNPGQNSSHKKPLLRIIGEIMPPDSTNFIQIFFDSRQWTPATIAAFLAVVVTLLSPFITLAVEEWLRRRKQWLLERDFGEQLYDTETIKRATRYYVPPDCSSIDPAQEAEIRRILPTQEKLFEKIDKYLSKDESGRHLLLLADSGMGKSSFVLNYYARNQRRKRQRLAVVPLGIANADEHIAKIEKQRDTVIFLDAFDEDTKAIRNHRDRLFELMQLCRSFKRVLITCRTQFFPKDEEIPTETGIVRVGPRGSDGRFYDFWKLYLSPLGDEQVERFVHKRYSVWRPAKRKKARQAIAKIPMLSARPMMLAFIPDLLEAGENITTSFELYELLVEKWLQREKGWVDSDDLRSFSEYLAVDLYLNRAKRQSERIPGPELEPLARTWRIKLDDWQLRGRSLLNRDAVGNYKFAHRSIMEYFVVKTLVSDPLVDAVDYTLTDQMEKFMIEFLDHNANQAILEKFITGIGSPLLFTQHRLMSRIDPRLRAQAGDNLAQRGDPRLEVTTLDHMEFCRVPGGEFWMGSDEHDDEKPLHLNKHLSHDYWISRFPITVAQYQLFVTATSHQPVDPDCLKDPVNRPVRYVTWHEAVKFCDWLTKYWREQGVLAKNLLVQLPSEAEWEKAARGGNKVPAQFLHLRVGELAQAEQQGLIENKEPKRRFPWGDKQDPNRANYDDTKIGNTSAVGCFPGDVLPYGCEEMSGNVWEWTRSLYKPYPYVPNDGRENLKAPDSESRVVRGGSFLDDARYVRCSYRFRHVPLDRYDYVGFRVVLSP